MIKKVSIVHSGEDKVKELVAKIYGFMDRHGIKVSREVDVSNIFPEEPIPVEEIERHTFQIDGDIMIVVGGDGTVLRALLGASDKEIPVLSIGTGERNFMASTTPDRLTEDLSNLIGNRFYIRREMRLRIKVDALESPPILNEVSYHSSNIGKTIKPIVRIKNGGGEDILWSVKSDGVLVSTPIGSTAYSYAAGGPVLDTDLEAIVITPLIPTSKIPSYVVSPNYRVVLTSDRSRSSPTVIIDGQISFNLDWDTPVEVYKAEEYAIFIVFDKRHNISRMAKVAGGEWL